MRSISRRTAVLCAAAIAVAGCRKAPQVDEREEPGQDGPRRAMEWFNHQRAFPGTRIPAGARLAGLTDVQRRWPSARRSISRANGANLAVVGAQWTALGPAPISGSTTNTGRIAALAVHPTNSQIIYAGAASGGVWKTTDGGNTWTPLTDSQCGLATGSIALNPSDPNVIYVGTGEQNFSGDSYQGCGVLRSTDGGTTWTQLGGSIFAATTGIAHIGKILVLASGAGSVSTTNLIAASSLGLYRSSNGGSTWTLVTSGTWTDAVIDPANGATIYAAKHGDGVWKSTNSGTSFSKVSTGLPGSNVGRIALSTGPGNSFFAALANNSTSALLGVYKTTDGGATWTAASTATTLCGSQCWYNIVVAVNPRTSDTIFFGGVSLSRSVDGGTAFSTVGSNVHVDHHAFAFDPSTPGTMYAGTDGGVFKSTDNGTTWTSINGNLNTVQFYPGISVHPTSATTFLGGTQDNGTLEGGTTLSWLRVTGGDGGATVYTPSGQAFAMFQAGSASPMRRDPPSTGTSGWVLKTSGMTSTEAANWVRPMVLDERNSSVLYFGTYRLWRTANSGDSWTAISTDLTSGQAGLTTIALAPSDSQTIYTGANDATVYVTRDLGTTWTKIGGAGNTNGLPARAVTDMTVDPLDPKTAWITLSGFSTTSGHVYKTVNGGATWTNISYNLPNLPVNAIVFQRGTRELYIAADVGIYSLGEGATSWTPVMAGMPNVPVIDLVYDGPRGRMVAATHGRGIWTIEVATAVLRGDITNNGQIEAVDAQAILSSIVGKALPTGSIRYPNGDANCDGSITALDALLVLSKVAVMNTGSNCVGTTK